MRPLKVTIEIYLDENSPVTGEEELKTKQTQAVLDLDSIESIWIDWSEKLRVSMQSRDSYCVVSHNFDQMYELWATKTNDIFKREGVTSFN